MNNELSIIIPVYNGEKYIAECLKCIMNQKYKNYSCIIIDDGSTDNSVNIISKIIAGDPRFSLIKKSNEGVSVARNDGIQICDTKYLTFVDCDDIVDEETYKKVMDVIKRTNADIVCYGMGILNDGENAVKFKKTNLVKQFLRYPTYMNSVCNKVFKKSLFENIKFSNGVTVCEDMLVSFKTCVIARKIEYVNQVLYHYRKEGRMTGGSNTSVKQLSDYKFLEDDLYQFCRQYDVYEKYKKYIKFRNIYYSMFYLTDYHFYNPHKYRTSISKNNFWIYSFRPDLLILSVFTVIHIDVFSKIYVKLKERKYDSK